MALKSRATPQGVALVASGHRLQLRAAYPAGTKSFGAGVEVQVVVEIEIRITGHKHQTVIGLLFVPSQTLLAEEVVDVLRQLGLEADVSDGSALSVDGRTVTVDFAEKAHPTPADLDRVGAVPGVAMLLVTDRLSEAGRAVLRERGIGWLDRRGHIRLWVPGLRVDASFTPLVAATRTAALSFTPAACELTFALLCDPKTKASPRRLGAHLERSPGYLSTVLTALADIGLIDDDGLAVVPELFWALNDAWARDWTMLSDEPAVVSSDGLVSGAHGAIGWGAPLLARDGDPMLVGLPDERSMRRVLARATPAPSRGRAGVGVRDLGPIFRLGEVRVGDRRVAHPLLCALDLGADQRSRESLATWRARNVDAGVLGYLEVLACTGTGSYDLLPFVESLAARTIESPVVWESLVASAWSHPRALARLVDDDRVNETVRGVVSERLRTLAADDRTAREILLSAPQLVLDSWWRHRLADMKPTSSSNDNDHGGWNERLLQVFSAGGDAITDGLSGYAREVLAEVAAESDTEPGVSFRAWWALGPAFALLRAEQRGLASLSQATSDALTDLVTAADQPTSDYLYRSWAAWSSGADPAWKTTSQRITRTRGRSTRSWLREVDELEPEDRGVPVCVLLPAASPREVPELVDRIRRVAPAIRDLHLRARVLSHTARFAGDAKGELLRDAMNAARAAVEQTTPSLTAGPERGGIYGLLHVVANLYGNERRDALIETTELWKRWIDPVRSERRPDRRMLFHSGGDTTLPLVRWLASEQLCDSLRTVFDTIREVAGNDGNALELILAHSGRPALANGDIELTALFVHEARTRTEWALRDRDRPGARPSEDDHDERADECPYQRAPFPPELAGFRNVWL